MSREGYCQKNNLHAALILRAFRHLLVCLFSAVGLSHCSLSVCVRCLLSACSSTLCGCMDANLSVHLCVGNRKQKAGMFSVEEQRGVRKTSLALKAVPEMRERMDV